MQKMRADRPDSIEGETNMKRWFERGGALAAVLALLLSLPGCGGPADDVTGGADAPAGVLAGDRNDASDFVDLPVIEPEDEALPAEDPAQTPEDEVPSTEESAQTPEDPAPVEDLGTGNGEEEPPYEDGLPDDGGAALEEDGTYNSAEDVSLYLYTFGHLPENYITKNKARDLGWTGGSVERVAPGCAIGGDRFGNREGVLPKGTYYECDIDTIGESSRGAKRLVYSDDGRIYYTEDHYETFTLLYGEE